MPVIGCPLALFRAGDPTVSASAVRFVEDAERTYLVDGPGVSHDTLMDEPHIGALARALTDVLDRASGSEPARVANAHRRGPPCDGERRRVAGVEIESV